MTAHERLTQEVSSLTEPMAAEVLDFVEFLKAKAALKVSLADWRATLEEEPAELSIEAWESLRQEPSVSLDEIKRDLGLS